MLKNRLISGFLVLLILHLNLYSCSSSRVNLRGNSLGYKYIVSGQEKPTIVTMQTGNKLYFKGVGMKEGEVNFVHRYTPYETTYDYSAKDDFLELIILPIATPIVLGAGLVNLVVMTPLSSFKEKKVYEAKGPKEHRASAITPFTRLFGSFIIPILPGINSYDIRKQLSRRASHSKKLDSIYDEVIPYPTKVGALRFYDYNNLAYQVFLDGNEVSFSKYSNDWNAVKVDSGKKDSKVVIKCLKNGEVMKTKKVRLSSS